MRSGLTAASSAARRPSLAASGMNGPSTSRSACSTTGMFTAVCTSSPSSAAALLRDDQARAILRLRRRAREVRRDDDLLECKQRAGVRLRFEHVQSRAGDLPGADRIGEASSSIRPPRAAFTIRTSRMRSNAASNRPVVCSLSGRWRVMRSDLRIHDLERRLDSTPSSRKRSSVTYRSYATTRIPRPCAPRLPADAAQAEHAERLPGARSPRRDRSHVPAVSAACAWGTLRATARQRDRVLGRRHDCRLRRVRDHDPRRVAASTSTLSTPTPARPITFSLAFSMSAASSVVPERITIASNSPMIDPSSDSASSTTSKRLLKLEPGLGDGLPDQDARGIRHGRLRGTPRALARRRRRAPRPRHSPPGAPRPPPVPS